MKKIEGITHYPAGEPFVMQPGWPPLPKDVVSLFGFKLIEIAGKKIWQAATEHDFRNTAKRMQIPDDRVEKIIAIKNGPDPLSICYVSNGACAGSCPTNYGECLGTLDGQGNLAFCNCVV